MVENNNKKKNKVFWAIAMFIHLSIGYGCFGATTVEMNSCDRDPMAHKA